ncbi:IQ motif and SEC7 domain-containing protein 1 [Daktulosphaira vitifoliae]|uniref:IQ motif and SEC7 domain-containing protein 1 n=1 Tax=Daktulosphaira vitifoliae TaxID=58002 RepID=UPI0021AA6A9C|nr:IQ motif and SEC7 domain-containing protein 1 [Daktulosphaira vitifoliae]
MCDNKKQRSQKFVNGVGCTQPMVHSINGGTATNSSSNYISLEQSMEIINQQRQEIYELRSQLNLVMNERDMLLSEISRLKFDIELYDQRTTLQDTREDKYDKSNNRNFLNQCDQYNHWTDTITKNNIVQPEPFHTTASYELSQDLIEKQIELLERKYGGDRARQAALVIQRAFRHYMLVKKFAHITAMAKAEKRLSKRLEETQSLRSHDSQFSIRSGSLREKKSGYSPTKCNSLPRSRSGRCDLNYYYDLESSCSHYYSHNYSYNNMKEDISSQMSRHQRMPNYLCSSSHCDSDLYGQESCNQYATNMSPSSCVYNVNSVVYASNISKNKVPPEVPKRTSSISFRSLRDQHQNLPSNTINKMSDSGSLSSVQSSGSDGSLSSQSHTINQTNSSVDSSMLSNSIVSWNKKSQVSDVIRKRQYRIGLNLFNKKPSKGIIYLVCKGFLDNSPHAVARFLISRKGLSKQMIGEYLGDLQNPFNAAVLEYFAQEIDLSGMQVDVALRKFQAFFRMPGEAQKIERLIEVFSHRYCHCNRDVVARLRNLDTVFILAFAIIMLNTDLHTPNLKPERRMKMNDFIKNLRGIDDCGDIDRDMLVGIYERIKTNEFKPGSDHVTQVMKVQSTIVGKKPNLALPHRRLVCYCRLYEVIDIYKKERPGVHQREVFLFNDLLVITKILSKKKNSVTYTFRQSFPLNGLTVSLFQLPHYQFGIKLSQRLDNHLLITFNARNDHDRCKFVEDIRESICEMDEMENLRIESELERHRHGHNNRSGNSNSDNRDSGVADIDLGPLPSPPMRSSKQNPDDSFGNLQTKQTTPKRAALTVT